MSHRYPMEIHFDFINGYLPSVGDMIDFLLATGGVTFGNNVTFSYSGAAPGFLFDVSIVNGGLVFTAQNNAQAVPEPPTPLLLAAALLWASALARRRSIA